MSCCSKRPGKCWDTLNALIVQNSKWTFPTIGKINYKASCNYTVYTVYKALCPNGVTLKDKSQPQKEGEE
jgi:hypothetical protein